MFFALIEGARLNAIRMQIECVTDIAAQSALAEFHRELQRQYDLFYVDTSYLTGKAGTGNTEEHIRRYMEQNFKREGSFLSGGVRDFTGLSLEEVSIDNARFAADNAQTSLREQIYAYMAADPAGSVAGKVLSKVDVFQGIDWDISKWQEKKAENDAAMEELLREEAEKEDEGEAPVIDNPAAEVDSLRIQPALRQVLTGQSVSEASVQTGNLASHRALHQGSGTSAANSHHYTAADALVFDQYLFEKCSRWNHALEKSVLQYEIEYILFGESSDRANLEKMAERLLLLREAANCTYLQRRNKNGTGGGAGTCAGAARPES